jgi:hypothetical protein
MRYETIVSYVLYIYNARAVIRKYLFVSEMFFVFV